jgi:hypothetical protein
MSYPATVFKVMIASPSDVLAERNIVRELLSEWNAVHADTRQIVLLPASSETHSVPEMGDRAQAIINKQVLKGCDLLVGVFWTRIGTATREFESGTVEEIEQHMKAERPTMLYFSSAPIVPNRVDAEQYSRLKSFKASCESRGVCESYTDIAEFRAKLYRHLQLKVNQDPYFQVAEMSSDAGTTAGLDPPDLVHLSHEAQVLLKACSADPAGQMLHTYHVGGPAILVGNTNIIEGNSARSRALWEGALNELEREGLVVVKGPHREIIEMTREGYAVADRLSL